MKENFLVSKRVHFLAFQKQTFHVIYTAQPTCNERKNFITLNINEYQSKPAVSSLSHYFLI